MVNNFSLYRRLEVDLNSLDELMVHFPLVWSLLVECEDGIDKGRYDETCAVNGSKDVFMGILFSECTRECGKAGGNS